MEFFDDKKNWNENEVKHGRSWKIDELRIKSNTDLHKIWYVLLKERNMLKTMEHEYKDKWRFWASPERIDKVEESMTNLETVVRERNKAYYQLEMGISGERPGRVEANQFGIKAFRQYDEYPIPKSMNADWYAENRKYYGFAVRKFLRLYREKQYLDKKKAHRRDVNHIIRLLRRNPDISDELLAEKYPNVNLYTIRYGDKARGHYVPKVD
jgi:large subunit ribosomal protein L47